MDFDFQNLGGWAHDHPDRIAFAQRAPQLQEIAPHLYQAVDPNASILLYKAWYDVLGKEPAYVAQEIGDCTSFGAGHTIDLTECIQIVIGKKNETYKETCTEAIYGMGREIANMLGGGDGCYGGAVAKAVTQGVVPREAVGAYSGSRAKSWGRSGVPKDIKDKGVDHKIKSYALVKTPDDVDAALANGYVGIVCSNQGFTMTRDGDGVCSARGHWAHCMSWSGRRVKNGRRQYCIDQSWGANTPSGPQSDNQPSFSFWIDESTFASMLSDQDSYVLSAFDGYPGQNIPSHWTPEGWA